MLINYSDVQHIHIGQFLFVCPGLLYFEHFLVVLEPVTVSVSTAVAASCCKISCSETAQTFVNKSVSKLLSNL